MFHAVRLNQKAAALCFGLVRQSTHAQLMYAYACTKGAREGQMMIMERSTDRNEERPVLFECAKLFEIQESTPGAGGENPLHSLGE